MRKGLVTVAVLLAVAVAGPASARTVASPGPVAPISPVGPIGKKDLGNAIAILSSSAAGARAALTLKLHAELQCGRPQARSFVVHLPAGMRVPGTIARAGVSLVGAAPLRVAVKAHVVTVTAPLRPGAICDVLAPGWFSIGFTHAVGLRNPVHPGSYTFAVSGLPGGTWSGKLTVH